MGKFVGRPDQYSPMLRAIESGRFNPKFYHNVALDLEQAVRTAISSLPSSVRPATGDADLFGSQSESARSWAQTTPPRSAARLAARSALHRPMPTI